MLFSNIHLIVALLEKATIVYTDVTPISIYRGIHVTIRLFLAVCLITTMCMNAPYEIRLFLINKGSNMFFVYKKKREK